MASNRNPLSVTHCWLLRLFCIACNRILSCGAGRSVQGAVRQRELGGGESSSAADGQAAGVGQHHQGPRSGCKDGSRPYDQNEPST